MTSNSAASYLGTGQQPPSTFFVAAPRVSKWPPAAVTALMVALVIPWVFSFGSVAVSLYRLVLLAVAVPTLAFWLSGKAGRIRAVDILLGLFCIWATIATIVVHGAMEAIEPSGILFLETFIAYLVARCYIRTYQDLVATTRILLLIVSVLLPLAIVEAITQQKLTLELFRLVLPSIQGTTNELRWGLARVQGPFEHPILFGVFCGAPAALAWLVLGVEARLVQRWTMTAIVAGTSMLALSSGPMVALLVQLALVVWSWTFQKTPFRWRILWVVCIVSYCALEVLSDQPVLHLLTRFAFDPWTAFYRLLIWEYGWASVMSHPLFGTGFNDWLRPAWMSSSIDMFWLLPAVRHGLPAGILLLSAFFAAYLAVSFKPCREQKLLACRTAYLITLSGFFLAGWAVHFWNATYVLFTFLLGSGIWILDASGGAAANPPVNARQGNSNRLGNSRVRPIRVSRQSYVQSAGNLSSHKDLG